MDIFEAVLTGNTPRVRELLDAVPEDSRLALVNQQNKNGETPLHQAAFCEHIEIARMLLDSGALINQQTNAGFTPLHWAARNERADIVRILFDAVPVNERLTIVNHQDTFGETPLHVAALLGRTDIARIFIAEGARLDAKDKKGQTPSQTARDNNNPEIADLIKSAQHRIANARQQTQNMALAMAQAFHPRLGAESPVAQFMPQDLLREVMTLVWQANEQEARQPQPEPEQAPRWCVIS
jgi:FOG: Ankyrin repeat